MEAKLRQMEARSSIINSSNPSTSSSQPSTSAHPSLPPKPIVIAPSISLPTTSSQSHHQHSTTSSTSTTRREKRFLPNLPLLSPSASRTISPRPSTLSTPIASPPAVLSHTKPTPSTTTVPSKRTASSLPGVRIVKNKKG